MHLRVVLVPRIKKKEGEEDKTASNLQQAPAASRTWLSILACSTTGPNPERRGKCFLITVIAES